MGKQILAVVLVIGGVSVFSYLYSYKFSNLEKNAA